MKGYQIYFFILKFIILIMLILGSLKIIPKDTRFFIITELIFKVSLGLFLIIFFSTHRIDGIDNENRIIIIVSGVVILLLIDYKKIINHIFGTKFIDNKII